uniref:Uncharacterized protein n=1 Tax=Cacopsylla melanoneura TaxID=428564 RepID=A0A8D8SDC2_9HEMI
MVCNRKLPVTVRIPVTLPYCVILPTLRPGRLVFEFFTIPSHFPTSYINRIEVGRYIKSSEFKKYLLNVLLLIIFFSEIYHVMNLFVCFIFCCFLCIFFTGTKDNISTPNKFTQTILYKYKRVC